MSDDAGKDKLRERALHFIASTSDTAKLRQMIKNARRQGGADVERAARLRLYFLLPKEEPGTLEHDVWQSIYALEGALTSERGKTILLGRTRQKIARDGEANTVADLILGKASDGFRMLIDRSMPELTFEALALRHPGRFDETVRTAAHDRLVAAGVR